MRVTYLPVNYKTESHSSLASENLFDPKAQLKSHDVDIPLYDQHLNEMGAEDWELISVQPLPNVEYTKKRDITVTGGFYFFWQRKPRPKVEEIATESLKSKNSFPDLSSPELSSSDVPSASVFNEAKETLFPRFPENASASSSNMSNTTVVKESVSTQSIKEEPFSSIIANSRIQGVGLNNNNDKNGTLDTVTENDVSDLTEDMSAWDSYSTQVATTKNEVSASTEDMSAWDSYSTQDITKKNEVSASTISDTVAWSTSAEQNNTLLESNTKDPSSPIEAEATISQPLKQESFTEKLMANNELKNKIDSIKGLLRGNVDTSTSNDISTDDVSTHSSTSSETKSQYSAEHDFSDFDTDILAEGSIAPTKFSQHLDEKNEKSSKGDGS